MSCCAVSCKGITKYLHMDFPLSSFTHKLILTVKMNLWWQLVIVHIRPCVVSDRRNEDVCICRVLHHPDGDGVMVIESWYTLKRMTLDSADGGWSLLSISLNNVRGESPSCFCLYVCAARCVYLLLCKQTTFKWNEVTSRGDTHSNTHAPVWTLCFNWHPHRRSPWRLFSEVFPCLCWSL